MEDGDEIDAMLHQTGGAAAWVLYLLVYVHCKISVHEFWFEVFCWIEW